MGSAIRCITTRNSWPRTDVKACAVDGVLPTSASIRSRRYPFITEVDVVVRRNLRPEHPARRLRDWLLSPAGQAVVEESGYVPVREAPGRKSANSLSGIPVSERLMDIEVAMCQAHDGHGQMSVDAVTDPGDWVDRHGDCLYRYALLRLRSPDLAADVVQETFLEALRARSSFSGRSSERTWLVGILRHKIVDHLRKVRRDSAASNGESVNGASESPSIAGAAGRSARPTGETNRAGKWRHASSGMRSTSAFPSSRRDSPTPSSSASWTAWTPTKSSRSWA